jgi:hypothetical protein
MIGSIKGGACVQNKDCHCGMPQKKKTVDATSGFREDKVSLHEEHVDAVTYGPTQQVQWKDDAEFSDLRELIVRLLLRQSQAFEAAEGGKGIKVDQQTRAEAEELISEDGYWGVEKTSDRIVRFAIAAAGNDPGKLEAIKAAVEKGFAMASDALGEALPEISLKTHDAIMEKLDTWAESVY